MFVRSCTLIGLLIVTGIVTQKCPNENEKDEFSDSHVGIIVSPIMTANVIRELEIYWYHPKFRLGDTIILCKDEIQECRNRVFTFSPEVRNGIIKTGIQANYVPMESLSFDKKCLDYYVAWIRDNVIQKTNCLSTEPNWMYDRRKILGNHTFRDIFLPGTHDSSSYCNKCKDPRDDSFIEEYIITQDLDVFSQLIYGVRYLDIRVGYYPSEKSVFWANHAFVRLRPLQIIIDDVKKFLKNTRKIVIFDLHKFPIGFGSGIDVHNKLITYLEKEFEEFLIPEGFSWENKLEDFWVSGKRLIIGYHNAQVWNIHPRILQSVTQKWGNVQNIEDLYEYLNQIEGNALGNHLSTPRSDMAELTPKTLDILLNRLHGLRRMAENVNINVTTWYNTLWNNSANIVAVDFIKGSGIIETAIDWNERRFSACD